MEPLFLFSFQVKNTGEECTGTVRIFLAPTLNESLKPFSFTEQRHLMIELDKFTATSKYKIQPSDIYFSLIQRRS